MPIKAPSILGKTKMPLQGAFLFLLLVLGIEYDVLLNVNTYHRLI